MLALLAGSGSCATEVPTSAESVNMLFTSRSPNSVVRAHSASRWSDWVFIVRVVNSTLSVSVTVRDGLCT
jgi:hypothetical protein